MLTGRRAGYTEPALKKSSRGHRDRQQILDGSAHGAVGAVRLSELMSKWGWSVSRFSGRVVDEARNRVLLSRREQEPPVSRDEPRPTINPQLMTEDRNPEVMAVAEALRRVDRRGTDVR